MALADRRRVGAPKQSGLMASTGRSCNWQVRASLDTSKLLQAEIEDIQAEQARLLEEYIDVQEEFARNYADVN